jgi:type II secretory pathway component HofQ
MGALLVMAWALTPASALAGPDSPRNGATASSESPAEKLRKALDEPRNLQIADGPLPTVVTQLRDQTKINFVLDTTTLMSMGMDPNQWTVSLRLEQTKVRVGLRTMLNPHHLTCVIIGDAALITTEEMAVNRQLHQRVSLDLDGVPLSRALRQLARETATNVLVDAKVHKESEAPLSLQLDDVPLETAVRLMAEMVGLKPVRLGNVLYVTSKANAAELRSDPDLTPNPGGSPGVPGRLDIALPPGVGGPAAGAPATPADVPPPPKDP